ncbi:MAG: HD domain-containing protein [Ktedonobacteraceae bacterium]|nr:HD domain-containing protein [Ktedonobacteraceae bacterium]MBO0792630.1 HD domain-containing protein [Ktedonobacteraceae bacterium]
MTTKEQELRSWLLKLAEETIEREGCKDGSHDYDHVVRVLALAETLQAREGGERKIIWAAAALHDIGQERERLHGGDHALIGADMAGELLSGSMFPQEAIPVVQQAIREHRLTGGVAPSTLEGRILYDADKLDCLGAIGIGRLYCITGRYNQKVYSTLPEGITRPVESDVVRQLRRRPDYSPSIEFQLLFGDMPGKMTTETGRALAHTRYEYMVEFFKRLQMEAAGEL